MIGFLEACALKVDVEENVAGWTVVTGDPASDRQLADLANCFRVCEGLCCSISSTLAGGGPVSPFWNSIPAALP